jgi:hypothetical protein
MSMCSFCELLGIFLSFDNMIIVDLCKSEVEQSNALQSSWLAGRIHRLESTWTRADSHWYAKRVSHPSYNPPEHCC